MTQQLHDALGRIAEQAPRLEVPADTWGRGRRARRRDRVLAGAAALTLVATLVATLGGLAALVVDRPEAGPADGLPDGGAVPSTIEPVPDRLMTLTADDPSAYRWDPEVAVTDLSVGRGSVAFLGGPTQSLPVLVGAADGAYHLLELPGWVGGGMLNLDTTGDQLALSPDGRQLAYAWWDPAAPLDRPMPSGVRVVDLATGEIRTIRLRGGNGVSVQSLVWSPDSRWLGWHGIRTRSWTPSSMGGGPTVAGVIGPDARRSKPVEVPVLAVGEDGSVLASRPRGRLLVGGTPVGGPRLSARTTSVSVSPDGSTVALGRATPAADVAFVAAATGRVTTHPLDPASHPEGALVEPLGWLDARRVVASVTPTFDVERNSGWSSRDRHLAVIDSRTGSVSAVGGIEVGSLSSLTVAVDLMSGARPTHDFPAPDWPATDEETALRVGLVVLGLALATYLLLRWRRRLRR